MAFVCTTLASSYPLTNNQLETSSNLMNQVDTQGRQTQSYVGNFSNGNDHIARHCTQPTKVQNYAWFKEKMLLAQVQKAGIALNGIDLYDSDYDDISTIKAVIMANLSSYGSDVLSNIPHSETYQNYMANQSVPAMQNFEQTPVVDFLDNEITSDSNIISYSQYLQETQQAAIEDTNLYAQQDSMILYVIEQMSE
ncbi:hypothetical protein Tco_0864277 [Tanacetum coccineum]